MSLQRAERCRTTRSIHVLLAKARATWPRACPHRTVTHASRHSRTPVTLDCLCRPAQPFRAPRPAMTHVQRLWLLCLAYASVTATTPTFGNAQTIVGAVVRWLHLLFAHRGRP